MTSITPLERTIEYETFTVRLPVSDDADFKNKIDDFARMFAFVRPFDKKPTLCARQTERGVDFYILKNPSKKFTTNYQGPISMDAERILFTDANYAVYFSEKNEKE